MRLCQGSKHGGSVRGEPSGAEPYATMELCSDGTFVVVLCPGKPPSTGLE